MSSKIIVVKFGSELVTNNSGVDQRLIDRYARCLVKTYKTESIIVVSSGAVKAGMFRATKQGINADKISKVTTSQLGSASIISAWETAFMKVGVLSGGLLVTHNELKDEHEGKNFVKALEQALKNNVVSIVNENDALSDTELMKLAVGGDNDGLAAHIAKKINAKKLILFTKNGGIQDHDGQIINTINSDNFIKVSEMLKAREKNSSKVNYGRGGIMTKFNAAHSAASFGIESIIAKPATDMSGQLVSRFMIG